MTTTISKWGNSEAVRLPKDKLRLVGLGKGDVVQLIVNERGNIEIIPDSAGRKGNRRRVVTFDELFKDYRPTDPLTTTPWPNDDFVGEEKSVWL